MFGEFLVQRGLISKEQLLEALFVQLEEAPILAIELRARGVLIPSQILQVLKAQQMHSGDFIQWCKRLNFWTEDMAMAIARISQEKRKPLGQVLIDMGAISLEKINEALGDYLGSTQVIGDVDQVGKIPEMLSTAVEDLGNKMFSDPGRGQEAPAPDKLIRALKGLALLYDCRPIQQLLNQAETALNQGQLENCRRNMKEIFNFMERGKCPN